MSVQAMSWVFEYSESKLAGRLVLLAIANHFSDDRWDSYPGIGLIAHEARVSESAVHEWLPKLKAMGELDYDLACSPRGTNLYRLPKFTAWMKTLRPSRQRKTSAESVPPTSRRRAEGVQITASKGTNSGPEPSGTITEPSVAARTDQAKIQGVQPPDAVENPVPPAALFNEAKKNHRPAPTWVKGEIAEDLYRGIHHNKIAATFFDAQHLSPREQLAACVSVAVTSLVTARVARLKPLSADEMERRAFEALLPGLATLELVGNFDVRRHQTVQAVTRAVIDVCVRMLKEHAERAP